jgi:hypothetical protein
MIWFRMIPLGYRNDSSKTTYVVLWKHSLIEKEVRDACQ